MTKISQLTATTTPVTNDEFALARSGSNFKLTFDNLRKGISSYINNTVFVDSTYGSDLTGALENIAKPYATITAAQTAAVTAGGEWAIIINTGAYSDTNLGANFMNYYFMPGAQLTSADNCFIDNASSLVYNVYGAGKFTSNGGTGEGICVLTGAASVVYFEGINAIGTNAGFNVSSGSRLTVDIKDYIYVYAEPALKLVTHASNDGYLSVRCNRIESECNVIQTTGGNSKGTVRLKAETIILNDNNVPEELYDQIGGSVHVWGYAYATSVGFSLVSMGAGSVIMNLYDDHYLNSNTTMSISGGICNIYGKIENYGLASTSTGGTLNLYNDFENSSASGVSVGLICSNGTMRVKGKVTNSQTGTTTKHGITVQNSGVLILDGAIIVLAASASFSVYAATAKNVKIYYAVSNYAMDANVTNTITGTAMIVDIDVV